MIKLSAGIVRLYMGMEVKLFGHEPHHLKAEGWIPCAEKLPPLSQFVIYRTPDYVATGKLEEDTWFFSGHRLEPEKRPVLGWQPLS